MAHFHTLCGGRGPKEQVAFEGEGPPKPLASRVFVVQWLPRAIRTKLMGGGDADGWERFLVGACAMTTNVLDYQSCTFKMLLSWDFSRKTAFLDDFPLCLQCPTPIKETQIIFCIVVSLSLNFVRFCMKVRCLLPSGERHRTIMQTLRSFGPPWTGQGTSHFFGGTNDVKNSSGLRLPEAIYVAIVSKSIALFMVGGS